MMSEVSLLCERLPTDTLMRVGQFGIMCHVMLSEIVIVRKSHGTVGVLALEGSLPGVRSPMFH